MFPIITLNSNYLLYFSDISDFVLENQPAFTLNLYQNT